MGNAARVAVLRLPEGHGLPLPAYMSERASGADLCAAIDVDVVLRPGERARISTGFALSLPQGFEAQVRPRSGLAWRTGLTCLNSPGTVDADYRGPLLVLLVNLGTESVTIRRGDRIAQLVIVPVERANFDVVERLDETTRGTGGFGSTDAVAKTAAR
ncbi:MAG: dUTP diphosphatase [Candidatus Tyrphobacter sp.]